ncbi:hypothetical protein SASPL_128356 [Salvia splendens]|uniref:HPP transmembrane region domain-containing protein n=1 Tax=Salvia splendens TaxID=180675 RepID=A0A8X8XDX6_SALSN|nr:hypothetical protein SASPL_128356 [Salvia splendens]
MMAAAQVFNQVLAPQTQLPSLHLFPLRTQKCDFHNHKRAFTSLTPQNSTKRRFYIASSSNAGAAPLWENWAPEKTSKAPSLSDIIWPSAGAFAAMALLGKIDQILAPKGVSITIAPLGAVCAVLFATPASPGARVIYVLNCQVVESAELDAIMQQDFQK